jgi:hypothetical protein
MSGNGYWHFFIRQFFLQTANFAGFSLSLLGSVSGEDLNCCAEKRREHGASTARRGELLGKSAGGQALMNYQ